MKTIILFFIILGLSTKKKKMYKNFFVHKLIANIKF